MFDDHILQDQIQEWLELQSIEEIIFDNDVTEIECIEILLRHGYIKWPEFLKYVEVDDIEET